MFYSFPLVSVFFFCDFSVFCPCTHMILLKKQSFCREQAVAYQGGRVVKALDLSSNVRMHTWVRTPFLVYGTLATSFFSTCFSFSSLYLLFSSVKYSFPPHWATSRSFYSVFHVCTSCEVVGHFHSDVCWYPVLRMRTARVGRTLL